MSICRFRVSITSADGEEDLASGTVLALDLTSAYWKAIEAGRGLLSSRSVERRYGTKPILVTVYLAPIETEHTDRALAELHPDHIGERYLMFDSAPDDQFIPPSPLEGQ